MVTKGHPPSGGVLINPELPEPNATLLKINTKVTRESEVSASHPALRLFIQRESRCDTFYISNKCNDFIFHISNFPLMSMDS